MSDYKDDISDETYKHYDERSKCFDVDINSQEKLISKVTFNSFEVISNSQDLDAFFFSITCDKIAFLAFIGNPDNSLSFFSKCILSKNVFLEFAEAFYNFNLSVSDVDPKIANKYAQFHFYYGPEHENYNKLLLQFISAQFIETSLTISSLLYL